MPRISLTTLVVPSYDEAITFYVSKLNFTLRHDTPLSDSKRWVVVVPPGSEDNSGLLLAEADNEKQRQAIGNQTGGRVCLFLETEDFDRDYELFKTNGVKFLEKPRKEVYATVAVFEDPWGNKWDLLQPAKAA